MTIILLKEQRSFEQIEKICDNALGPICAIVLVTGAGGMFGGVLRASGIGDVLAKMFSDTGMPIIVAAFLSFYRTSCSSRFCNCCSDHNFCSHRTNGVISHRLKSI